MNRHFAWTVFAVWTTLALLSVAQTALFLTQRGTPVPWGPLLSHRMLDWYTCAIFTPIFFWLARRWPIDSAHWRTAVPITVGVSVVCVVLKYALFVLIRQHVLGNPEASLARELSANFFLELMIFWAVIGTVQAYVMTQRVREREQLAVELRARLTEARLEALQGQLRPHFLFNTLNGISTLIHTDPDAADRTVVQLGELLRASLDRPGVQEIPLSDELELLQRYLAIMRTRFHDRLHVELDVDPDAHDALVPQFILQPLVENALEHGIARRAGMGRIRFSAHVTRGGEALRLAVADDGPGPPPNDGAGMVDEGVGLANTRLRLQQLYDDRQQLTMDRGPFGGMEVAIELPLRAMPRARAEALA